MTKNEFINKRQKAFVDNDTMMVVILKSANGKVDICMHGNVEINIENYINKFTDNETYDEILDVRFINGNKLLNFLTM